MVSPLRAWWPTDGRAPAVDWSEGPPTAATNVVRPTAACGDVPGKGRWNGALERFVREMDRLDFVGYSMLVNRWMLDWGIAWNEHECGKLVDEYQQGGSWSGTR